MVNFPLVAYNLHLQGDTGGEDVTLPDSEIKLDVSTNMVTEEQQKTDLDKNFREDIGELQEESEEEESRGTETEPTTQPMTSGSEDEERREEVGLDFK